MIRMGLGAVALLLLHLLPFGSSAHAQRAWFFGPSVGWYEIHEPGETGIAASLVVGRAWTGAAVAASVTQGFGSDAFSALEPSVELRLPDAGRLHAVMGGGGGLMLEQNGSLALPFFIQGGVGVRFGERTDLRVLVRRGSHANTGDSGTFRGPHMISAGLLRY